MFRLMENYHDPEKQADAILQVEHQGDTITHDIIHKLNQTFITPSEPHALVAGLAGAGMATAGPSVLLWEGWKKVIIGIGFSTFLGFFLAFCLMVILYRRVGTFVGGWRIIKTMGLRLTKLETVHGFAAETSAGFAIELASRLGIPVSTTHTIVTSIMGVGATRRLSAVRWGVGANIVAAWILTFPVCGLIAWLVTKTFMLFS